jgi:hypothetical protein
MYTTLVGLMMLLIISKVIMIWPYREECNNHNDQNTLSPKSKSLLELSEHCIKINCSKIEIILKNGFFYKWHPLMNF